MKKLTPEQAEKIHEDGDDNWEMIEKTDSPFELNYIEGFDHPEHLDSDDIFIIQEVYSKIKSFIYKRKDKILHMGGRNIMNKLDLAEKIHEQIDCNIEGPESKGWVAEYGDNECNPTFFKFDIPDNVDELEKFDFVVEGRFEKRIHYKKVK